MIRVGRCSYLRNGKRTDPKYPGFKNILVMMKSHSKWWPLSPYELKDENGRIHENIWQFSKCYENVPKSVQYYSRYNNTVIWDHPKEVHIDNDGLITSEYMNWRNKGFYNKYAVRYPVGFHQRHTCVCMFPEDEDGNILPETPLGYIEGRKRVYLPTYKKLVKRTKEYQELKELLTNGINLLIVEVDGPHQESLNYYRQQYNVSNSFIEGDTMLATPENLEIMLNDAKHPFGHGYCLATALLEDL